MEVTQLVLELQAHKAKIKGVSKRLLCSYGNLLCWKNDHNLLGNNWEFVWYDFQVYKWKMW